MQVQTDTIRTFFGKMGLEPEIADIYLSLYSNGPQSISELSRTSGVERTRIYRLIDDLLSSNLIEMETNGTRGFIKAAPVSNLRYLITEREQATKNLSDELGLIEQVLGHNSLSNSAYRAHSQDGPEGFRRMLGHELQAMTEILVYSHPGAADIAGNRFMTGWERDFSANGLNTRILSNSPVTTPNTRLLGQDIYAITHRVAIYDDTVASYFIKDGHAYGLELTSADIAGRERQLFDLLWTRSTP